MGASKAWSNYTMMNLIYLACLSAVMAAPPQQPPVYPTPAPTQGYHPDIGQSCYNIPRKIQVEVCKTDVHRYCEKFSNIFPFPVEEQNCHFEPKKICELEM